VQHQEASVMRNFQGTETSYRSTSKDHAQSNQVQIIQISNHGNKEVIRENAKIPFFTFQRISFKTWLTETFSTAIQV
jgi:hypothetical protein